MNKRDKQLARLAIAIHEQLQPEGPPTARIRLPGSTWREIERLQRRISRARSRGWHLAARRLQNDLRHTCRKLRDELAAIEDRFQSFQRKSGTSSVGDVHADLTALRDEFVDTAFDRRRGTLSVTTEPIELDGIDLGPFEICLEWGGLGETDENRYRVIALDASPAASNESVTHPHVQDEQVCEGEGRQAIS